MRKLFVMFVLVACAKTEPVATTMSGEREEVHVGKATVESLPMHYKVILSACNREDHRHVMVECDMVATELVIAAHNICRKTHNLATRKACKEELGIVGGTQ